MRQAVHSFAALVVLAAGLAACANVERGTTPHNGRDTMPGPGLFSGPPGEWMSSIAASPPPHTNVVREMV